MTNKSSEFDLDYSTEIKLFSAKVKAKKGKAVSKMHVNIMKELKVGTDVKSDLKCSNRSELKFPGKEDGHEIYV